MASNGCNLAFTIWREPVNASPEAFLATNLRPLLTTPTLKCSGREVDAPQPTLRQEAMVGVRVVVGAISVAVLFGAAKGFVVLPPATMTKTNSLSAGAARISSPLLQQSVGRRISGLRMSSLSLDSFESGGADPEAAIKNLDELVPRSKITALIKQTSDLEGAKQCLFNIMCYSVCAAGMVTMGATSPLGYWASMIAMAFVM